MEGNLTPLPSRVGKGATPLPVAEERTGEGSSPDKAQRVSRMFADIARRYDFMNRLMTFGRDRVWRRLAVAELACRLGDVVLDVGTGTADFLPLLVGCGCRAVGVDFSLAMMLAGRDKLSANDNLTALVAGDALHLPFADDSFAGLINGFLLRNVTDLPAALAEMHRVVKPGGRIVCLELTWPTLPLFRQAFALYFSHLVPFIGGLVSGQRDAYAYLPRSVAAFVNVSELMALMKQAGLQDVHYRRLALGTVALHVGLK